MSAQEVTFVHGSDVSLVEHMGSDMTVVEAAVVSTGLDSQYWPQERVAGLISRLMRDRHGAPFEHVLFRFVIRTPLFTARQLMRHRTASFNEASGRYRELPPVFYVPPDDRPVRQVGKAMDYRFETDHNLSTLVLNETRYHCVEAHVSYTRLLEAGVAREVARMVLPTNVMTELVMTVNLRSLLNVLSLRGHGESLFPSHPQYEIAQLADKMETCVQAVTPLSHAAFVNGGRVQP